VIPSRGDRPEDPAWALVALVDSELRFICANSASVPLLGYEPTELVGRPCGLVLGAAAAAVVKEAFGTHRGVPPAPQESVARRKEGMEVRIRLEAARMTGEQGALDLVALTAQSLRSKDEPASDGPGEVSSGEALIESLPAIVYVAEPGEHGAWHYISPQVERMLGYRPEDWLADPELWSHRLHPDDRGRVLDDEERDIERGAPLANEYRMITRDEAVIWIRDEAVLRFDERGAPRYEGILLDITERKRFESKLQFLAEHDELTGLLNRRSFMSELDRELKRYRRHNQAASLLMIDLDNLKTVNDALGHAVGDKVIRATALALSGGLRESDATARLGGDEFAALLRGPGRARGAKVAEKLIEAIAEQTRLSTDGRATTRASVGVAELSSAFVSPEDLVAAADAAMFEAKRSGGGRVVPATDLGAFHAKRPSRALGN
jgi:diguanylate cyclase (GGDEF)-like protein/PAS domain S-box-containing protein